MKGLDRDVHISPDYGTVATPGSGERGYVDFYINSTHNIGIELTRDGQRLGLHEARFREGGIYAALMLSSWIVVDFRQVKPLPETIEKHPKTLFVVLSKDFKVATIMQHGRDDDTFCLSDD